MELLADMINDILKKCSTNDIEIYINDYYGIENNIIDYVDYNSGTGGTIGGFDNTATSENSVSDNEVKETIQDIIDLISSWIYDDHNEYRDMSFDYVIDEWAGGDVNEVFEDDNDVYDWAADVVNDTQIALIAVLNNLKEEIKTI